MVWKREKNNVIIIFYLNNYLIEPKEKQIKVKKKINTIYTVYKNILAL